jgi:hypothetical protein
MEHVGRMNLKLPLLHNSLFRVQYSLAQYLFLYLETLLYETGNIFIGDGADNISL